MAKSFWNAALIITVPTVTVPLSGLLQRNETLPAQLDGFQELLCARVPQLPAERRRWRRASPVRDACHRAGYKTILARATTDLTSLAKTLPHRSTAEGALADWRSDFRS